MRSNNSVQHNAERIVYSRGMHKRFFIILICWLTVGLAAQGQNQLTGQVVDSLTHEPVPFANVFFAKTSIGTTTDEKGAFALRDFASGKYDLTVSFVGYKTITVALGFTGKTREVLIYLKQETVELNEVVINPNYVQKAADLRKFERMFLGENKNASACKITNEKDLVAYEDHDQNTFIAFANAPLKIRNDALGYMLIYELENFEVNYNTLVQNYSGIPRFEELTPKNLAQKRRWQDERQRAYEGSFVQLIHFLRKGSMGHFNVNEVYRVPNRKRPEEEFLKQKVKFWRSKFLSARGTVNGSKTDQDSMRYYVNLYNQPAIRDSVGRMLSINDLLDQSHEHIIYEGTVQISYRGEKEEQAYVKLTRIDNRYDQRSIITFKKSGIAIYDNGYYEPITDVFFDGYMMWSDRISNLLPREYTPPH